VRRLLRDGRAAGCPYAARALRPALKVLFITGSAENAALNHGHVERGMEVDPSRSRWMSWRGGWSGY